MSSFQSKSNRLLLNDSTESTSTSTGALVIIGGIGIGGNLNMSGDLDIGGAANIASLTLYSTTDTISSGTGTLVVNGGVSVAKNLRVGSSAYMAGDLIATQSWVTANTTVLTTNSNLSVGTLLLNTTTNSTSITTGTLIVAGGAGIAKSVFVGGDITIPATQTFFGGYLNISGTSFTNVFGGAVSITLTTASTSTTSGALTVAGGAGIAKTIYGGSELVLTNSNLGVQLNAIDRPLVTRGHDPFSSGTYNGVGRWGLFMLPATLTLGIPDNYATSLNISTFNVNSTVTKAWFNLAGQTGVVTLYSTVDSSSTSTGGLVTSGGLGVAKNLYVGTSIYMSGNLVATQSWANSTFQSAVTTATALSIGTLTLNTTTDSTNATTGALTVAGGAGIAKNLYVGTNIYAGGNLVATQSWANGTFQPAVTTATVLSIGTLTLNTTTDSSSVSTGALIVNGGIGVAQSLYVGSALNVAGAASVTLTTDSSSSSTGAVIISGGAGVAKNLYVGTSIYAGGNLVATQTWANGTFQPAVTTGTALSIGTLTLNTTTDSSSVSTGALIVNGGIGVAQSLYVGSALNVAGAASVTLTTDSSSSSTGAVIIGGGAGIAKNLYVGTNIYAGGNLVATQSWANGTFQPAVTTATALSIGTLALNTTTDSSSATTGALTVGGGIGIAKTIYGGSEFVLTNTNLGVQLNASDRPLVTRGHNPFTSGNYSGAGRFGVYMLASTLTLGVPDNVGTPNINMSTFNANSTVTKTWFNLVSTTGVVTLSSTNDSSSISTGALVSAGGVGVAKNLYVGSALNVAGAASVTMTTDSASLSTGAVIISGGVGVAKSLYVGSALNVAGAASVTLTTDSSSSSSGAVIISGGAGVAKNLYVGSALNVAGAASVTVTTDSASSSTGAVIISGGAGVAKNLYVGTNAYMSGALVATQSWANGTFQPAVTTATVLSIGTLTLNTTTDASSVSTGALIVNGGVGVAKNMYVGSALNVAGAASVTLTTDSSSSSTGAVIIGGGAGVAKNLYVGTSIYMGGNLIATQSWANSTFQPAVTTATALSIGTLTLNTTTDASSVSTGALIVNGGVGVAKSLYVGSALNVAGAASVTVTTDSASSSTGAVIIGGGIGVAKSLYVGSALNVAGAASVTLTTDSSSSSTGAVIISGGAGVAKNLYVGTSIYMGGNLVATQTWANGVFQPAVTTATVLSIGTLALNTTTDSSSTTTGALTVAGGASIVKTLYVGGNAYFNHSGGIGGTPTLRVSPSTNGAESSIGFYQNTSASGASWAIGHNTNSAGSNVLGIYNSTIGGNTLTIDSKGTMTICAVNATATPSASTAGNQLTVSGRTFTNSSTAASGTLAAWYGTYCGVPTLAASNTGVTTTAAATMYVAGAPIGGTNNTITNSYALLVADGAVKLAATADSTSSSTGAFVAAGGAGVGGTMYVGGSLYMGGALVATQSWANGTFQPAVTTSTALSIGTLALNTTTDSSSTTTGALTVAGGAGIAKSMYIGGSLNVNQSGLSSTPMLKVSPSTNGGESSLGFYINTAAGSSNWVIGQNCGSAGSNVFCVYSSSLGTNVMTFQTSAIVTARGTTDSTTHTNGTLIVQGGVGIAKNLYVGTNIYLGGNLVATQSWANGTFQPAVTTSTALSIGTLALNTTTDASSTTTGALTVAGGVGVAKSMYIGGSLNVNQSALSGTPTLKVSPSSNGGESSIGFFQNTAASGAGWILGHNTGTAGSNVFGVYNTTLGYNTLTINSLGTVSMTLVNVTGTPVSTGNQLNIGSYTFTNSSTAASGTLAAWYGTYLGVPTIAASNTGVTTTNAATLYVAGAPAAGTNNTITNPYGVWNAGTTRLDGNVTLGANVLLSTSGTSHYPSSSSGNNNSYFGYFSGGDQSATTGAYIGMSGVNRTTFGGYLELRAGTSGAKNQIDIAIGTTAYATLFNTGVFGHLSTTDSTSTSSGSVTIAGGLGVSKAMYVGGNVTLLDTTAGSNKPQLGIYSSGGGTGNSVGIRMSPWNGRAGGDPVVIQAVDDGTSAAYLSFQIASGSGSATTNELVRMYQTYMSVKGNMVPSSDNTMSLGGSTSLRWSVVYAANGTIQTSDARLKTDVRYLDEDADPYVGINFIDKLRPASYMLVSNQNDGHPLRGRRNCGLIAQDIIAAVYDNDEDRAKSTALVTQGDDGFFGVSYTELTGHLIKSVQELIARVYALEERLARLGIN